MPDGWLNCIPQSRPLKAKSMRLDSLSELPECLSRWRRWAVGSDQRGAGRNDAKRYSEESNMFRRLTTHFFIISSRLFITFGLIFAVAPTAEAQEACDPS